MKWAAIFLVINFNQSNFNCLITSASTLCVLAFKLENRERGREGERVREGEREGVITCTCTPLNVHHYYMILIVIPANKVNDYYYHLQV